LLDGDYGAQAVIRNRRARRARRSREASLVDHSLMSGPVARIDPVSDSSILGGGVTNDTTPTIAGQGCHAR
jgi:hypothetical protein